MVKIQFFIFKITQEHIKSNDLYIKHSSIETLIFVTAPMKGAIADSLIYVSW